ncbi:unnamed protein product [Symbiodinium natans]|uniref:Uncharacterized protein n=1 Tax=Symbiodinium natans TaxID=878477 RepID=A0A812SS66_9DINO|nr:unnamed protein product [Symbiodinium natans]CAE7498183.1 unnamed protein product [Symbiodinium natans]
MASAKAGRESPVESTPAVDSYLHLHVGGLEKPACSPVCETGVAQEGTLAGDAVTSDAMTAALETMVLASDTDLLAQLMMPRSKKHLQIHQKAVHFLVEYRLRQWICEQNLMARLPPSISEAAEMYVTLCFHLCPDHPRAARMQRALEDGAVQHSAGRYFRRWAKKFQYEWGFKLGQLRPASHLSSEDIKQKAPASVSQAPATVSLSCILSTPCDPNPRPHLASKKQSICLSWRKPEPKFRLVNCSHIWLRSLPFLVGRCSCVGKGAGT